MDLLFLTFSEDDLTEVLQVEEVFSNATQGQIASESQLESAFPGLDKTATIKYVKWLLVESQTLDPGTRRNVDFPKRERGVHRQ